MSDEQFEAAIEADRGDACGSQLVRPVKVIEGTVESVSRLPGRSWRLCSNLPRRKPNRLMMEADTAIGPRERKPRKVPSPAGA